MFPDKNWILGRRKRKDLGDLKCGFRDPGRALPADIADPVIGCRH